MPAQFDELLAHPSSCDTLTDDEVAALQQEITRDVITELMFGAQQSDRAIRRATKADRAASHLRSVVCNLLDHADARDHLARFIDDLTDIEGAVHFACVLSFAQEPEEAIWWWQFAASAGNPTAAYCLYLLYLSRGDLRDAEHWMSQVLTPGNRIDVMPPPSWTHELPDSRSAVFREAVRHLKVVEVAGTHLHHPDHRFLEQIAHHPAFADSLKPGILPRRLPPRPHPW